MHIEGQGSSRMTPAGGGLRNRILQAGLWTVSGHIAETLISLATNLIMTRLLIPEAFGLMSVAITIPVSLILLTDVGIRSNIIQKKGAVDPVFVNTAWTIHVIRGVLLWGVTLVLAALLYFPPLRHAMPADSILLNPRLPPLIAVMGSILAITGLASANLFLQERAIRVNRIVLLSLFSKISPLPIMLLWAFYYQSVWSLAAGAIMSQATSALSSHFLIPGARMRLSWDRQYARDLLISGKWVMLSTASGFFATQGDRLALATILTTHQMGLYAIAWALTDALRALLNRLHAQMTLPVLSELFRTRPASARDAYYKYRMPIDAFAFSTAGFLYIAGPTIINFLYDDRYSGAGWILQVLGLSLVSLPFQIINFAFIANDEWRSFSMNSVLVSLSFFLATALGYYLGGWTGAVWGIALHSWPATLPLLARAHKRGWIDPVREISMTPFALFGAALGYAAPWLLQWFKVLI